MGKEISRTKERASRIELDYFNHRSGLLRWKRFLAIGAAVLALGWSAIAMVRRDESPYSPGRLAWAHATWENQCSACHVDFVPIRDDAWVAGTVDALRTMDQKCQHCHTTGVHHHGQRPLESACSSCHQEHQGRATPLTRVADRACTECHADIKEHLDPKSEPRFANVTSFDVENHRRFRSIEGSDPGKLKFSHRRHLTPGMSLGPVNRPDAKRLNNIPEKFREQYERFSDAQGLITLDCSACHGLDSGSKVAVAADSQITATVPASGDDMQPVVYDRHRQACHALGFEPPPSKSDSPVPKAEESPPKEVLPHGLDRDQIGRFLDGAFTAKAIAKDPSVLDRSLARERKLPDRPTADGATIGEERRQRADFVRSRCAYCHELAQSADDVDLLPQVLAVQVPAVWLQHARFDHFAHRDLVKCQDCHPIASLNGASPPQSETWLDNSKVLIPQIEKCLECHSPAGELDGKAHGGARFDCTECHAYHPKRGSTP